MNKLCDSASVNLQIGTDKRLQVRLSQSGTQAVLTEYKISPGQPESHTLFRYASDDNRPDIDYNRTAHDKPHRHGQRTHRHIPNLDFQSLMRSVPSVC